MFIASTSRLVSSWIAWFRRMSIRLLDHGFTSFLSIVHGVLSLFQLDDCLTSWSLVTTLGWIDRYRHSHRPCLFFSPRPAFISPRGNFVTWSITRALCWYLVGRIHWPCGRGIQSTVYKNLRLYSSDNMYILTWISLRVDGHQIMATYTTWREAWETVGSGDVDFGLMWHSIA